MEINKMTNFKNLMKFFIQLNDKLKDMEFDFFDKIFKEENSKFD